MKILKKGICLTGEIIGLSTEVLLRTGGIGIESLYKKLENSKNKNIEKMAKDIGEKASNLIIEESKNIANSADKLADNLMKKTKDIANQVVVKEVKIYGDANYIYDNKNLVNGEFKVCD